jgi:SWIM zinc finger
MSALGRLVAESTDSMRFLRGLELMERGMVASLVIEPGRALAIVRGSSKVPYSVDVTSITSGGLPSSLSQLRFRCTCPDWGDPCKHAVAVTLELAERLDDDSDLLARFVAVESSDAAPEPVMVSTTPQRAELPTSRPMWADDVMPPVGPRATADFFGSVPIPVIPRRAGVRKRTSAEVADLLGPLVVDDLDLAPDIVRLLGLLTSS